MTFLRRLTATVALLAIIGVAGFGVCTMMLGSTMDDCPMQGALASMCPLALNDYLAAWQQFFLGIPGTTAFFIFLIAAALGSGVCVVHNFLETFAPSPPASARAPDTKLFNCFVLIFSAGLLNPRLDC